MTPAIALDRIIRNIRISIGPEMICTKLLNFVIQNISDWPEIERQSISSLTDDVLSQRSVGALSNWVAIPYIYFRRAGHQVTYSRTPKPGMINIASGIDLGLRERTIDAFVVSCRADGHRPMLANHIFEQNGFNAQKPAVSWMHHPPQPGLIPRDASRGNRIETVAFKGDINNLDERFRNHDFCAKLAKRGIALRIDERKAPPHDGMRMHDYSDVDLVLAVRALTKKDSLVKPASKLINAWRAHAPALLGPEYAFQELRRSELDYIEIITPEDFFKGVDKLIDNRRLYQQMIENGRVRAREHTESILVSSWIDTIEDRVMPDFVKWSGSSRLYRLWYFGTKGVLEKASKEVALYNRNKGESILDTISAS